jgi:hypothetical protein
VSIKLGSDLSIYLASDRDRDARSAGSGVGWCVSETRNGSERMLGRLGMSRVGDNRERKRSGEGRKEEWLKLGKQGRRERRRGYVEDGLSGTRPLLLY